MKTVRFSESGIVNHYYMVDTDGDQSGEYVRKETAEKLVEALRSVTLEYRLHVGLDDEIAKAVIKQAEAALALAEEQP